MATSRIIWNGKPGEVYANNTERFKYQLIVAYTNSCGFCIQYDRAISNWWPITFHFRCRCKQLLIKPGGKSTPFIDFRVKLSDLSEAQKVSAIGRSNYTLLGKGVVKWDDIVTETRVRSFAEVAQRAKFDLKTMLASGVDPEQARHALERINTPKQIVVREQRAKLIERIQKAGLSDAQIKEAVSVRIGEKIGIGGGKAQSTVTQASTRRSILPRPLRDVLDYFGRKLRGLFGSRQSDAILPFDASANAAPQPRTRKATPKATPAPGRFTTHAEVEDWAKQLFPKATVVAEGVSLESWHAIADELDHLVPKFPGMAENIIGFGTSDAASHAVAWVKPNDVKGDALHFNPAYWGDLKKARKVFDKSAKTGWIPEGVEDAGPQYFVTHEFGHMVDSWARRNHRAKYLDAHAVFKGSDNQFDAAKGGSVSQYAATSTTESFAEAFAGARWSSKPNPLINAFKEMFGL